jgi:alpha-2-macroglobulin
MKSLSFFCFISFTMLLSSCQPQPEKQRPVDHSGFEDFIVGYSSGVLPASTDIKILTAKPLTGFQPGTELPDKVFLFRPAVQGKAVVVDSYTILFTPDRPLPSGQHYEATFNLQSLLDIPKEQQRFVFHFQVIEQDFTVFRGRLFMHDLNRPHLLRYEGKLVTADLMKPEEASKLIKVKSPYKEFEVKLTPDGLNTFSYSIDDIPRLEESYSMELLWDGRPLNIERRGSFKVEIASVNEFKLLSYEVNRPDQSVLLTFSDPVDPNQQLAGLVQIKNLEKPRISRNGALVTIFPGERLTGEQRVKIDRTLRNSKGVLLGESLTLLVAMETLPPQLEVIGSGSIMPDSEGLMLPFRAVSLRAVDVIVYKVFSDNIRQFFQSNAIDNNYNLNFVGRPVFMQTVSLDKNPGTDLSQWNGFSVDLTRMVKTDPTAIYRVKFAFKKDYAFYECGTLIEPLDIEPLTLREEEQSYWDGSAYWYSDWPANYDWRDRDNPCTESYYTDDRFPARNILHSNLGLLVKSADNRRFNVVVTDLLTAAPMGGAKVEFFNFQQQKLGEVNTAPDGMAEVTLDHTPFLASATHGNQRSWMRLDNGNALSLSNFDVSGKEVVKGIKGFIYGERGVWRPGDTLFLTFVMNDVTKKLPANHPVLFELLDARGNLVEKQVKNQGVDNFYTFITPTNPEAATGNWKAKMSVGGAVFEKRLKIEHVKPNRLKMDIDFGKDILVAGDRTQSGTLQSYWLHGTPASGLRATLEMNLRHSEHKFNGYEKFSFSNLSKSFWPTQEIIFDEKLDQNGRAVIPLLLETNRFAPGMLSAVFTTRVFEQGGDFSTDVLSIPFAPFPHLIGLNITGVSADKNRLETDKDHKIGIVTLSNAGKPVSLTGLDFRVYRLSWRWWWGADNDNLADWISGEGTELIMQQQFKTVNGHAEQPFRVDYPAWGHYFVEVSDPAGGHTTGMLLFLDWPAHVNRAGRQNPAGATMLAFSADKEKYATGEKARITFPSSPGARALVSLENGSEALLSTWVECSDNETTFDFDITGKMAPNVYAHITLLQPHHQTNNDLPIRMYGVIPIMVEDPETILQPLIKTPETIRPESEYTIKVLEKNGRAMTYTLAVVDEGLLGLTRFQTPNPRQSFFAREAHGIKTWDLFDDVMGAYGGQLQKILAIGGDDELQKPENQKANRFKPVVTFAGPFSLEAKSEGIHTFQMPNYIGEVRVMAIAGKEGAWGAAESAVTVKQPLMVLPTLPRVLSPLEEVNLPVSVFALDKSIRNVSISIETEGIIATSDETSHSLTYSNTGEQMVFFGLIAGNKEGVGIVKVVAVSGSETAIAEIEIDVLHPNPITPVVNNYLLQPGEQRDIQINYHGIEGTNTANVVFSGLPSFNLEKNLHRLINYPYGCLEQVVSAAFAQLYLTDIVSLSDNEKIKIDKNIRTTISKLPGYRMAGGDLSYWPGGGYTSAWGAVYAGHFMFLAAQKGYPVHGNLKQEWLQRHFDLASRFDPHSNQTSSSAKFTQAYRLYVLALAGQPAFSAMNRLREDKALSQSALWRLAAAYWLAGRPEAAEQLIQTSGDILSMNYHSSDETFGSTLRDQAMILETLILTNENSKANDLLNKMAIEYDGEHMSTQTSAFVLYSLARYIQRAGSDYGLNFGYTINGKSENILTDRPLFALQPDLSNQPIKAFSVNNRGKGDLHVTTTIKGKPDYETEKTDSRNLDMQIKYFTIDGKPAEIFNLKQGIDFVAEITIKNPVLSGDYRNMAMSFTAPSGWEILNRRLHDMETGNAESTFSYRDISDDRVDTFFDLPANQTVKFRIELNAAYNGRFYLPAVKCEAMYDHTIYAVEKGEWVKVIR